MNRRFVIILVIVGAIVAMPVAWYLISPLFIDRTVNEELPFVSDAPSSPVEDNKEAEGIEESVVPVVPSSPVEDSEEAEAMEEADVPVEATEAMEETPESPDDETEEAMSADEEMPSANILAQGSLYDLAHAGHGLATIYELEDGSHILRFEDFEVLNGPELHVYLTNVDPVPNAVGVDLSEYIDLGLLKGNIGDQNYEIPEGFDPEIYKSVVIWCEPFRVPFNAAPLAPTG